MENTDFPKFHVVDEWFVADNLVCVQLVEVALNRREQLSGARVGIGLHIAGHGGEETLGMVFSPHVGTEMCAALERALKRHEQLTTVA